MAGEEEKVTLIEYLQMRRQVEQADLNLIAQADSLAEWVKKQGLPTLNQQWDALIAKAEEAGCV